MGIRYVLINPVSGKCNWNKIVAYFDKIADGIENKYVNITDITDYVEFIGNLKCDDEIVVCGGDGTLSRFADSIKNLSFENRVSFYPAGTGNDFCNDLNIKKVREPFDVKKYIHNLPMVRVNGEEHVFINGIGYGIDGYCCEEGDKLHEKGVKKVNYTKIALKGLLGDFSPVNAKVTVDGKTYEYEKNTHVHLH